MNKQVFISAVEKRTTIREAAAVATMIFVLSDFFILLDNFIWPQGPDLDNLIMITYYLAQFGITLSVSEEEEEDNNEIKEE